MASHILIRLVIVSPSVTVSQVTVRTDGWVDVGTPTTMTCSASDVRRIQWVIITDTSGPNGYLIVDLKILSGMLRNGTQIDPARYEFGQSGDFPLTIRSAELVDEGTYRCLIVTTIGGSGADEEPLQVRGTLYVYISH